MDGAGCWFVCLFVEFALHRALNIQAPTYRADRLRVTRRPRLIIGEHMNDVRLSLVVTKLLWIPLRTSAPNLPNAPSHLWLGGLNLYLLTETPTPSIATGVEYFLYPRGPHL